MPAFNIIKPSSYEGSVPKVMNRASNSTLEVWRWGPGILVMYTSEAEQRTGQPGRIRTDSPAVTSLPTLRFARCRTPSPCRNPLILNLLLLFEPALDVVSKSHWHSFLVEGTHPCIGCIDKSRRHHAHSQRTLNAIRRSVLDESLSPSRVILGTPIHSPATQPVPSPATQSPSTASQSTPTNTPTFFAKAETPQDSPTRAPA